MTKYAQGGLILGDEPISGTMRRVHNCNNGHSLFVIDGAAPQHLITKDEAAGPVGLEKLTCQQGMDR